MTVYIQSFESFQNLVFSFRDVDKSCRVSYTGSGSGAGRSAIISGTADFAGSNTLFSVSELVGKPKFWALLSSVSALIMTYNLPEAPSSKQLVIDRGTAVGIYTNQIKWWNDTAFKSLNPGINFPNKSINLVYRSDKSGTTNTFLQALTSFDPSAKLKVGDDFDWAFKSETSRALPAAGNTQGSFRVSLNPYTIGYMSASFASGLSYFKMINKNGKVVSPTTDAVQSAVAYGVAAGNKNLTTTASYTSPLGNLANTIDAAADDAWPMAEFDYYLIPDIINKDCFKALQIAQFLIWSIRSSTAVDAMLFLNYIPISGDALKTVLNTIVQAKCGDDGSQLVFDTIFPYERAIIAVAIAFSVCCVILSGLVAWKAKHPMVARVGAWRLGLMCWGFAINLFTVYLWVGFPTQPICSARPWVSAISFMFVFGMIISQMHDRVVNKKKYLQSNLYDEENNSESDHASEYTAKSDVSNSSDSTSTVTLAATTSSAVLELATTNPLFGNTTAATAVAAGVKVDAPAPKPAIAAVPSSSEAAGRRKRLAFTASGSGVRTGAASSSYGSKTSADSQTSLGEFKLQVYDLVFRSFGLLLVILINLIIPIVWVLLSFPTEEYRACTGAYSETFRQVMIFYNLFLVGSLALSVASNNRVQESSYPAHILVLVTALFVPLQFVQKGDSTDSLPNRSTLMVILSPAVGVIASTVLSMLLIVSPPLYDAFTMDVDEALEAIDVENEVYRVRQSLGFE